MQRDTRHLEDAYRQYWKQVFGYISAKISCKETAADLAQETYIRFFRAKPAEGVKDARSYLFRIASNLVVDHYRSVNKQSAPREVCEISSLSEKLSVDCDIEADTERRSQINRIHRHMEDLSAGCQRIFWLSRFYGYKNVEIADLEGVCLSTVEKNLSKATRHCREHFTSACA